MTVNKSGMHMHIRYLTLFLAVLLSGCSSITDYNTAVIGGFSAKDDIFRVNSDDYPVFASKRDREAPKANVIPALEQDGSEKPIIYKKYRWYVTHNVNGRYLIGSPEYDKAECRHDLEEHPSLDRELCGPEGEGPDHLPRIYLNKDGSVYAWEFVKDQENWHWPHKETWFRMDNTGDWSGQPWFECIARCDKLDNMVETPPIDEKRMGLKALLQNLPEQYLK